MFTKSTSNEIIDNVCRVGVVPLSQISIFILISIISRKVYAYCNVTEYWRLWPEFLKFDPSDPKSWIRHWLSVSAPYCNIGVAQWRHVMEAMICPGIPPKVEYWQGCRILLETF